MRQPFLRFALVLTALPMARGAIHAQVRDSASVAAIVRRSEDEFASAVVARDTARLRAVTWPQFAVVSPERIAAPLTRGVWFSDVRASHMVSFSPRDVMVRVFSRRPPWHRWADMAIASFVADLRTSDRGADQTETVFFTDTWRLDGNHWRMIERSASPIGVPAVAAQSARQGRP
jgi:hypothetical protein